MKEFTLPFKPEARIFLFLPAATQELLAQPPEGRLWAADLPDVESCSEKELNKRLDGAVGRLLTSQGKAMYWLGFHVPTGLGPTRHLLSSLCPVASLAEACLGH